MKIEDRRRLPLELNWPQLLTFYARQKHKFLEWGRGTGKSTMIGIEISEVIHQMPRSTNFIVGETYQQILTRTLPSTIESLEKLGLKKDLHFFVGRRPPKSWKWPEPFQTTLDYQHFIIFYTGAGYHLISQDRTGRGLNTDSGIGDEAALLEPEKLDTDVLATNRGNKKRFGHLPKHHSTLFASSLPQTNRGKWIYKLEEAAREKPDQHFYLSASAEFNRHNLGDEWFDFMKRKMTKILYQTEILNIRHDKVTGGFYGLLDDKRHTYSQFNYTYLDAMDFDFSKIQSADCAQDADLIADMPLEIAFDYGAAINCLVIGQESNYTFKTINALHVKHPFRIKDLVNKFCDYYQPHLEKHVFYHYDHTAIGGDAARSFTYADEVISTLTSRGWTVTPVYMGQAASHDTRYNFWAIALHGDDDRLPSFAWNKHHCKYLLISMNGAGVRQGRNGFEKDKSDEKNPSIDQELTTHFSDAMDTLAFSKYGDRLGDNFFGLPTRIMVA